MDETSKTPAVGVGDLAVREDAMTTEYKLVQKNNHISNKTDPDMDRRDLKMDHRTCIGTGIGTELDLQQNMMQSPKNQTYIPTDASAAGSAKSPAVPEKNRPVAKTAKTDSKSSKLEIYYDRVLGEGAFAKVYVAKYKGKLVAVKIIDIRNAKEKLIKQFKRELDIIRIIQIQPHPNLAEYYKIIEDYKNERIIIIMEWCRGGELSTLIKAGLNTVQIKHYFSQIVAGYTHLLGLNIIHRDMKSQNIILSHDLKTIKIIDFGLSKVVHTDMTRTVVGSPAYMAPERLQAQDYDSTSDIWSLGIILYEMLYQNNPFKDCKNKAMLIKSSNEPIELPHFRQCTDLHDGILTRKTERVPDYLRDFADGMLKNNPADRFDWEEVNIRSGLLELDVDEVDHLDRLIEFYCEVRKDTVCKGREVEQTAAPKRRKRIDADTEPMFDMEIGNGKNLNTSNNDSIQDSRDSLHHSNKESDQDDTNTQKDQGSSEKQRGQMSAPISIPVKKRLRQTTDNGSPPVIAESVGNVAKASVEDRQIECLEEYFMTNSPGIFGLYEEQKTKIRPRVRADEDAFVDISFLDTIPFLQDGYKAGDQNAFERLKTSSSQISTMIVSRSAPVVSGLTKMVKKTAKTIGDMIGQSPK